MKSTFIRMQKKVLSNRKIIIESSYKKEIFLILLNSTNLIAIKAQASMNLK